MLSPKSFGFKKTHRGHLTSLLEVKSLLPLNGGYGIKSLKYGNILRLQLLAILKYLRRNIKKKDRFWFVIFPSVMITRKGLGARMGKGKGLVEDYKAQVRLGRILIEFGGFFLTRKQIRVVYRACQFKLPLPVKLVKRYI